VRILTEIDEYLRNPIGVLRTLGRYRHRNGGIVHVESRIISRQSATIGGGVRLVGAMSDVTTKVVADQQMGDAIESLSDGFAWFGADDRMIMHNRRFLEFFPFLAGMGDLTGLPFIEMVCHPEGEMGQVADPEAYVTDRMKQHREGGSFELPLFNGGWVRVSERRTKEGGIVSIWSDITELKRAQQRLMDAVAAMQEGFLLVGPDDEIILANQRCREIYAIAGHLLEPGRSYRDFLLYGAENGQFIEAVGRAEDYVTEVLEMLHSERNLRVERELADGRWILISQRLMSDGSVVGIRTDLTAQKRREAELESAQHQLEKQAATLVELAEKLEEARLNAVEASRAKTRFLAHMSHELRTPLNAVLGFTRVMDDELFGPIGIPKYKEYIGLIHESGAHLLSLINDVLDLSKIEAGRMELDRRQISVEELAASSTRLMEGLAKDRQIKLLVQVMPGCISVYGDERSLKQIIINLLSNALKFTEAGGRVTLSFAQRDDGGSALTVIDTGIGMTADDIIKALDPFGQVDGEIARQHHGTGLGLPLVKAMAEAHGGSLSVDSEPDIGTTMTVYLPGESGVIIAEPQSARLPLLDDGGMMPDAPANDLLEAASGDDVIEFPSLADSFATLEADMTNTPTTPETPAEPGRPRILLAEDNAVNRRLVVDILKEMPIEVDCAANGEEAVKLVSAGAYVLVLMDVQMPRMGGVEASERIRASGISQADLPIVALTAHASQADQARFLAAGMDGFLAKPFDVAALMKLIQRYLVAGRDKSRASAQAS
jgi:signal transduction histidine kinase/ActR/RegA family two-component response regulator